MLLAALVVVAAALRLIHLNDQLWLDEISALTGSIQRPFGEIVTRWPGSASHIFYELLARAGLLVFGSPLGIRLPAAIFGIAGVAIAYAFARRAFGLRPALVISGLMAVSYHHVFFSQNARGYTLLMALYLATLALITEAQHRRTVATPLLALYAVVGALAAYSMPMGFFILPGQALVFLALWWRARATRRSPEVPPALFGAAVAGGILAALLYAPFVPSIMRFTRMNAASPAEGPRIGFGLVREVIDGLLSAFHGPIGLTLVAVFGLAGLVRWWQRHPVSLMAAFAPLLLEAVVVVAVGIGIHPRYFAVALPVLLIVAGLGVDAIIAAIAERLPLAPARRPTVLAAMLGVIILVSAWPLVRYYKYPKQDYLGVVGELDRRQPPCGARVGLGAAGRVLEGYYHTNVVMVEKLPELLAIENSARARDGAGPVCVVTTLEGLLGIAQADLVAHVRREYTRVAYLPGTVGDGAMRIYQRNTR